MGSAPSLKCVGKFFARDDATEQGRLHFIVCMVAGYLTRYTSTGRRRKYCMHNRMRDFFPSHISEFRAGAGSNRSQPVDTIERYVASTLVKAHETHKTKPSSKQHFS